MGYNLLINGVYWGYSPPILTIDPNFLGHPNRQPFGIFFSEISSVHPGGVSPWDAGALPQTFRAVDGGHTSHLEI